MKETKKEDKKAINIPEAKLNLHTLTRDEFEEHVKKRISRIGKEFTRGFEFLEGMERTITIFGSARFKEDDPNYIQARELAHLASQYGFGVVTGGGPGIMEAGNRGAFETNGQSLGLNIELPHEQATNPYMNRTTEFEYFFTRKVLMSYAAEAYIFFPGGFGTFDEFFEMLTLIQTKKIEPVPIICIGKEFWERIDLFIKEEMLEKHDAIDAEDRDLYTITDDLEVAMEIIKNAPIRKQT